MAEQSITKAEFERLLKAWGDLVREEMRGKVSSGTHGSGLLKKQLKTQVRENVKESSHWVGFKFPRYGVFVHYGVGRGWVRSGDTVVRGSRVKKDSEIWHHLKKKGYSKKELSSYIVAGTGGKPRKAVDWFDSVLKAHIEELADVATEYYGDNALEQLSEMLDRMTIGKKKA